MQNPFIWHDLMTPNVEGAKKFYGEVVGWTFTSQPPAYAVANADGKGIGGIMATPDHLAGMPPFWSGYIYTPDVDAAARKAKSLGGTVHREPWDIPGILRMAVLADPGGAVFNIMQPLSQEERQLPKAGAPGTVGWNELHAANLEKAWDFYEQMFGWSKGYAHDMGTEGPYQLWQINGKDTGGMMNKMDVTPRPVWLYYFFVDGMEAAVARITKAGGKIAFGPMQVPGGQWTVHGVDPQGGYFALISNTK